MVPSSIPDILLLAAGVSKSFTGTVALDEVDFNLRKGEIHALMGENGAGKSTLIKVLTGVHRPDRGELFLEGKPISPGSPQDAVDLGISTVYQEINLLPNLSVAENICLGREDRGPLGIRWKAMHERARQALARIGVDVDVARSLSSCSVAVSQLVAIARALDVSCKTLILDEPTSSLDRHEVEQLFQVLRKLREEGLGIVFVTHFIDQVYEISDRITVLRNGRLVGEYETGSLPKLDLVSAMIGRDASGLEHKHPEREEATEASPVLAVRGLGRKQSVEGVTADVVPGEILGLAGLLGSGRTETIRLMYGIDDRTAGSLEIDARPKRRWTTLGAVRSGFGLCPEDRKQAGILPGLSVRENMALVVQSRRGWWRRMTRREQRSLVERYIQQLKIATSDAEKPIEQLSGGNQQKVLLARWLAAEPRLLFLDEPTRGIDVGAKFEIALLVESLRANGMAFVFVSSELEEVVRACTKVAVLRDGRMVELLRGDEIQESRIMATIAGERE